MKVDFEDVNEFGNETSHADKPKSKIVKVVAIAIFRQSSSSCWIEYAHSKQS